jgi:hypothetical protein
MKMKELLTELGEPTGKPVPKLNATAPTMKAPKDTEYRGYCVSPNPPQ